MSKHFLIMYHPPREDFATNYSQEESDAVGRHFEYLKELHAKAIVQMAGRVEDARFGICLLKVEFEQQAQEIVKNDPAVLEGVFKAELLPFILALG